MMKIPMPRLYATFLIIGVMCVTKITRQGPRSGLRLNWLV